MEYEIVNLEEKIAVGLSARTSNASPDMGAVIGGLWNQFYNGGVYASIQGKANQKALGIYTEYEGDEKAQYTVLVACEVAEGRETGEYPGRALCEVCHPWGHGSGCGRSLAGNMEHGFAKDIPL